MDPVLVGIRPTPALCLHDVDSDDVHWLADLEPLLPRLDVQHP
jgi:hypothetical protein